MKELRKLAENENIDVIEKYLPSRLKGFYFRKGRDMLICLEKRLNNLNKKMVLAHELGHHFKSYGDTFNISKIDCNDISRSELVAKRWEADFLIPEIILENNVLPYLDIYPLCIIAEDINVTEEILKIRLEIYKNDK